MANGSDLLMKSLFAKFSHEICNSIVLIDKSFENNCLSKIWRESTCTTSVFGSLFVDVVQPHIGKTFNNNV